jgi:hypothetical protein
MRAASGSVTPLSPVCMKEHILVREHIIIREQILVREHILVRTGVQSFLLRDSSVAGMCLCV